MGSRGACLVALVSLLAMASGCLGNQERTDGDTNSGTTIPGEETIDPGDSDELAGHPRASLRWVEGAPLPTARRDLTCALHGSKIWIVGGVNAQGITESRVDIFDIKQQEWERGLPLPKPLHSAAAASVEGELLVMGGFQDLAGRYRHASSDVYGLSQVGFWTELGRLPGPLALASPVAHSTPLLLVGGTDGTRATDSMLLRSPVMQSWAEAGQMNEARVAPAAVLVDDSVHVIGGQVGEENNGSGEILSLRGDASRATANMPTPRANFAAATAGTYVYVIGGSTDGSALNQTEVYDATSGTWSAGPTLPIIAQRACAVSAGDGIHFFGGHNGAGTLLSHWILTWL